MARPPDSAPEADAARPLAAIPKVDRVLAELGAVSAAPEVVKRFVRDALDAARARVRAGEAAPTAVEVSVAVNAALARLGGGGLARVLNATGVVLHTNLGRAPLSRSAVDAVARTAGGYADLELDLATGKRGRRAGFAEDALALLSGAEAALLVNNCAAAVLLVLGALATGRRVLVSRGELVEIGGGFRVPEVLARSGASLVEVGTTNKTRVADYAAELERGDVAAILRVHQGNFRQTGFVERPRREELAELAKAWSVPLVEDLGGGALVDLAAFGLPGEPTVGACVAGGADLVCFSTDKVLGGPQGGAIVGRKALVDRARRDPLARALRIGRLPLAALEATLSHYLEGRAEQDVPALAALAAPLDEVRARAARWAARLREGGVEVEALDLEVEVGGGALADTPLPSAGVALGGDVESLARRLRAGEPAVVGRVEAGRLVLDARTVLPVEDDELLAAVLAASRSADPRP